MEERGLKARGLTAFELKLIALVIMTLDHIGAFGFEIPAVAAHYSALRFIGRLAAPIFLMLCAESLIHTRSKGRYLLRLYAAAALTGLFTLVTNALFGGVVGVFTPGNIIFTLFYTGVYALLARRAADSVRAGRWGEAAAAVMTMAALLLTESARLWLRSLSGSQLWHDLADALVASPASVEYGFGFVALGTLFYLFPEKSSRCLIFLAFCALCRAGAAIPAVRLTGFSVLASYPQYYMVLALPLMWLYNGRKGGGGKYFFYLYYPLHRYAIRAAAMLITR